MSRLHRRASRGDEGVATVMALGIAAVLAVVTVTVASLGMVLVTRHGAESAADLAALAAASRAIEGETTACAVARRTAEAVNVRLVGCHLRDNFDAVVEVAVRAPGKLGALGEVHVTSVAGRR